jgi:hypothetical protein
MINGNGTAGGVRTGRKPTPVPFCSAQIPYYQIWHRTRASGMGSQCQGRLLDFIHIAYQHEVTLNP